MPKLIIPGQMLAIECESWDELEKLRVMFDEEESRLVIEKAFWPNGPVCPYCKAGANHISKIFGKRRGLYRCNWCSNRRQFSVTVGTPLESTHLPFRSWLFAFRLLAEGVPWGSGKRIQRALSIPYATAWRIVAVVKGLRLEGYWPALMANPVLR